MFLTELQEDVLGWVKLATPDTPISGAELIRRCGRYKDEKKKGANMRAVINALRTKNYPICSSDRGYFYPNTVADIDKAIASLEGRVSSIQKAIAGMKNGRHNFKQQLVIKNMK